MCQSISPTVCPTTYLWLCLLCLISMNVSMHWLRRRSRPSHLFEIGMSPAQCILNQRHKLPNVSIGYTPLVQDASASKLIRKRKSRPSVANVLGLLDKGSELILNMVLIVYRISLTYVAFPVCVIDIHAMIAPLFAVLYITACWSQTFRKVLLISFWTPWKYLRYCNTCVNVS